MQTYERAMEAVPKSIDLWVHYCSFTAEYYHDPEKVRQVFERAVAACGMDFLSHPLWDKYLEYEESRGHMDQVLNILDRVIRLPLHQYVRYFEKYVCNCFIWLVHQIDSLNWHTRDPWTTYSRNLS